MLDSLLKDDELLANIQTRWSELAELLEEVSSHWVYEDLVYRFYHQSFKVYRLQDETRRVVDALQSLAPSGTTLSPMFREIYQAGASGKQFELEHNQQWTLHTRVFLEAFFHAKFFLEMAVKYGKELRAAPTTLPSGWAALLYLYKLR
ncbi:MAG: hypothetical protein AABN34_02650 [Acidobacteriota bacterium]